MKTVRVLLLVALLATTVFVVRSPAPVTAQVTYDDGCAELNDSFFDDKYPAAGHGAPVFFLTGDVVTILAEEPDPPSGATSFFFWLDTQSIASHVYPGQMDYTFAEDRTADSFAITTSPVIDATFTVSCVPAPGERIPPVSEEETPAAAAAVVAPVPGCDLGMTLTADAAVGAFVWTTDVYWGPDVNATTGISMPAGKTAWVLGMDESGEFYKFVWSCTYLWAPVGAMGPNHDAVWNGTALPATVVE